MKLGKIARTIFTTGALALPLAGCSTSTPQDAFKKLITEAPEPSTTLIVKILESGGTKLTEITIPSEEQHINSKPDDPKEIGEIVFTRRFKANIGPKEIRKALEDCKIEVISVEPVGVNPDANAYEIKVITRWEKLKPLLEKP